MYILVNKMDKKTFIGVLYSIAYVVLVPAANFIRETFLKKSNSIIFLFYAFIFSFIFFNIINIKNIRLIYKKSIYSKYLFFKINIFILFIWGCSFLAPVYFGAVYSVLTIFSVIGLLGIINSKFKREDSIKLIQKNLSVIFYLSGIILIFIHAFVSKTFFGLSVSLSSGIFTFLYIKNSQKFSQEASLSAAEVLAVRYWGVFAFLPMLFFEKNNILTIALNPHLLLISVFVSFISMILPVYFNQKSLYYIEYKLTSTILSFIPFVTWLIYLIQGKNDYNSVLITIICLLIFFGGILSILSKVYFYKQNKQLKINRNN